MRSFVEKVDFTNTDCSSVGARHIADTLCNTLIPCNIHTLVLDSNPVRLDTA